MNAATDSTPRQCPTFSNRTPIPAGKLAPLDLPQFWADQDAAIRDPFGASIPQLPLGIMMSNECVFDELGIPEDWHRLVHDDAFRVAVSKAYNDIAEQIVGRRLINETPRDLERQWPAHKQLYDIFEGKNIWHQESYWLMQAADTEAELEALLDRVERRLENLREFLLPPQWEEEKKRLTALGVPAPAYRFQRGPITFATSIFGAENLIYLFDDNPDLVIRFRDLMLRAMHGMAKVLDDEAGRTPQNRPHGFQFNDDNCCLLNKDMYELFGYPILKSMFETYSPNKGDHRGQHSDSAMGHLLPLLGKMNLTYANFGPTLTVREIRAHCPTAAIHGQLAPFTFSRNEEENMIRELHRDFEQARDHRGVVFHTAGSINNGSRLTGLRLIMSEIQRHCRF